MKNVRVLIFVVVGELVCQLPSSVSAEVCGSLLLQGDTAAFEACRANSGDTTDVPDVEPLQMSEGDSEAQRLQRDLIEMKNKGTSKKKIKAKACDYVKAYQRNAGSLSTYCAKIRTTIKNECVKNNPDKNEGTCAGEAQKEADACMVLSSYCKGGVKLEK